MRKRKRYLNAVALSLAGVLFGYGVLTSTPASLASSAQTMLGAVGMTVAVAPNQYNTLAQQLSDKQKKLDQREADITAKEAAASTQSDIHSYGFWSLCASVLLTVLVACNFYFDYRRKGRVEPARRFSVDLR